VAALVEATADTVSSEIGQAFGGEPVLIGDYVRVEPGTDGAVTLSGSCAVLQPRPWSQSRGMGNASERSSDSDIAWRVRRTLLR